MLNIILLILKIIGIIVLFVVALAIFIIILVLFMPIKYTVEGGIHNDFSTLKLQGKVRWLFRILGFTFSLTSHSFEWSARVFWKRLNLDENVNNKKEDKEDKEEIEEKIEEAHKETKVVDITEERKKIEDAFLLEEEKYASENLMKTDKVATEKVKTKKVKTDKRVKNKTKESKLKRIYKNIKSKLKHFSNTISKIYDTIKQMKEKKEKILELYHMEVHQYAIGKVKKELIYILKRLKPREFNIQGEFGFDDPSMTGQCLGVLSVLYPIYAGTIELQPNFCEKVYECDLKMKGRIRLYPFVMVAIKMLLDKRIRETYKNIRRFEF